MRRQVGATLWFTQTLPLKEAAKEGHFNRALWISTAMNQSGMIKYFLQLGVNPNFSISVTGSRLVKELYDQKSIELCTVTRYEQRPAIRLVKLFLFYDADIRREKVTKTYNRVSTCITPLKFIMLDIEDIEKALCDFGCYISLPANHDQILVEYVSLLYAAGGDHIVEYLSYVYPLSCKSIIEKFLTGINISKIMLSNICRKFIRNHLLSQNGGNNNNLITAVPQLLLPEKLKKFLLFDVDITGWENVSCNELNTTFMNGYPEEFQIPGEMPSKLYWDSD